MIIKQKQANQGESPPIRSREGREYVKEGCQLTEFPTIKLHILQNVEVLNLSNNFINDLSSLETHSQTSQHVLANLKVVNLSKNKLLDVLALAPLAMAAKNVLEINIGDNPLTQTLNFLYEIVLMFRQVRRIDSGSVLNIGSDLRVNIIEHQLQGGDCIAHFIETIKLRTENVAYCLRFKQEILFIQKLLTQLQIEIQEVPSQNSLIFQTINQYLSFCSSQGDSRRTYRSPRPHKQTPRQIQAISQYQINTSPNNLLQYLTEVDQHERPIPLMRFYYQEVTLSTVIQNKILQEIQLEEAQVERIERGDLTGFSHQQFITEVSNKWKQQYGLTSRFAPQAISNQRSVINTLSPFKSIQTDITSRRQTVQMIRSRREGEENYFFGLDSDWTRQTRRFVTHRLLSLLRLMSQRGDILEREESQPEVQIKDNGQISQYLSSENYQTFGSANPPAKSLQIKVQSESRLLEAHNILSPKSRNKYIVGSCVSVLEQAIRRIAFKKICNAKPIKRSDVVHLMEFMQVVVKRWLQAGLRRIYQQSLFYDCLRKKMEQLKKRCVFKAWKMVRRRKMKLMKALLSRKFKKQQAFLVVFTAQWRIASRNMKLAQKMKQAEEHFKANSKGIEQMSCILKRSSTCQRITVAGNDRRWTKGLTRGESTGFKSFMRKLK